MNPGAIEEGAKVASTTVEAMKSVPLAIALLVVNLGFLAFAGWVLTQVANNAGERNKSQMELISKLAEDLRDCTHYQPNKTP
jgi:hypothetical protein